MSGTVYSDPFLEEEEELKSCELPWSSSSGSSASWSPVVPPPILSIHRHLCYNLANPSAPPELLWDVIHPPDSARIYNPRLLLFWEKPDFDAEPVHPSVNRVCIGCDHNVLSYWFEKWGPITISSEKITVRLVLERIYNYLRAPLTHDDLRELSTLPGNNEALHFARAQRARDSSELDAVVLASDFRRVDVAGSHRQFQGMRIVVYPDNTWRLHFSILPGTVSRHR